MRKIKFGRFKKKSFTLLLSFLQTRVETEFLYSLGYKKLREVTRKITFNAIVDEQKLSQSNFIMHILRLNRYDFASNNNNIINIWNLDDDYYNKSELEGHTDLVNCIIKLDDKLIASGSLDKSVKIWNFKTAKCEDTIKGFSGFSLALIKLTKNKFALASDDGSILIYEFKLGVNTKTLEGSSSLRVYNIIKLSDNQLASGSLDFSIKVWDFHSGECLKTLRDCTENLASIIKLNENKIAISAKDKKIKIWDFSSKNDNLTIIDIGKIGNVYGFIKLTEKNYASRNSDKSIGIWDFF